MATLFLIKLVVVITVVVGLSIIAEHGSPRLAGLLSGYPTGSAITLFFFGLELSPQFAAHSAVYNMIGMVAMQVLIYAYYKTSCRHGIIASSLVGVGSYFFAIWLLHFIRLNMFIAATIPAVAIIVFLWLFRPIQNTVIQKRAPLKYSVLFLRALFAACIILLVTGMAKLVGPTWSGLFSSFPTTLFPLMLIVHFTYDTQHVHTIIKNVPVGLLSLVLYSLSVAIVYPLYGVYWGTIMSFGVATTYLLVYQFLRQTVTSFLRRS